ncbi:LysR family transcriptional regulator [Rhodobium gokarnense]|uniref:LysR family glycine cleavage system transcriptional activator n=1 Tax=Rhodobium gokarnense TaxID=364296 RepID=A0ABT3HEY6_9HYPH|nr:LysR family transcriptional regulator [Rhodobium gokarnense]MCW2308968.1 LysR family glycine cleavage system transcriptional activator [Rhodobium gokarnense]
MRDIGLNGMVYFEAVARHSRVTTAAQELSVSPSAVSQQLKGLEEVLGVKLFRRVKRSLVLTEEGEQLFGAATEALSILRDARRQVARKRENRKLILRVSASFGARWLGRRFAKFIAANPLWDLHVDATPELTEFEKENVDLDVRYGVGRWKGLYAEAIVNDMVMPLCNPAFLKDCRERGTTPEAMLSDVRLIHTVKANLTWKWWLNRHAIENVPSDGGLKFDRSSMSLQAAKDGAGVVLETATLAMDELHAGTLVPMFPALGAARFPAYWIVCPNRNLNRRYVSVFCEWLREEAAEHEDEKLDLLASLGCTSFYDVDMERARPV